MGSEVKTDEMVLLLGDRVALKVPSFMVPSSMSHKGDYLISVSEMVNWLGGVARDLGVEIYTGFAARELVVEDGAVRGIKLGEKGLNREGGRQPNYVPGEVLEARVTVLGEGSAGLLSEALVRRFSLGADRNAQVYSLGVKEIIRLSDQNSFGANRVIRMVGFPSRPDIFGGGAIYSMGADSVSIVLVMGLDWRYCDLDPQRELQIFKSHSFIRKLIAGGEVVAYGAKTIPEGGFYSVPELTAPGAIHREDQPSHVTFSEEGKDSGCSQEFGCHPCAAFCPAEVYKFKGDELILSPSNCLHCQTCRLKCPHQVIQWRVPEGGDGPSYRLM
ncbi:MAG: hypothetical protein COX52_05485 [Syntrophobacterales bacterium CG23_combo_of_CG06-09_8_20_14_all_48_27]|nr:MAG: hypothetical protein COX52_05485 [Syntrophobacterales bacterium CG23_combo_of_CG06-09_8_20_14_all_48_27]